MTVNEHISVECPECAQDIAIELSRTSGPEHDPGGHVLKCGNCNAIFHFPLDRGVTGSKVLAGAELVDTYRDALGNKDDVFRRHGLAKLIGANSIMIQAARAVTQAEVYISG